MAINFKIILVIIFIFLINIPFGIWRENTRRFSINWFLSVHLPVPFIFLIRKNAGINLNPFLFVTFILSFFLGQFTGTRISKFLKKK
jgi:hypothetical protein